jgi:BirA family transcriptional regulator, biotin operon repressor / biotin---[acetyl-CoA-carboxylase] ligase
VDQASVSSALGNPRIHLRLADSTNERARRLAERGAPHGTMVTAAEQTAGRGRQGRTWSAPAGRAILCSVVVRDPPRLLPLAAGVAVAETVDELRSQAANHPSGADTGPATLKWPNDVLVGGLKVAGILVEGRPQEGWAVVGTGINVAVRDQDFPDELRGIAATLGLEPQALGPALEQLLGALGHWITAPADAVLEVVRARDALRGHTVRWAGGQGEAVGVDEDGRLLVASDHGQVALDAGEVHLVRS